MKKLFALILLFGSLGFSQGIEPSLGIGLDKVAPSGKVWNVATDCTGSANGGALTINASGEIVCTDDNSAAAGTGDDVLVNTVDVLDPDITDSTTIEWTVTMSEVVASIIADALTATELDETDQYAFSNVANTFVGASYTGPTADPADSGILRGANAEALVCAEASPAGTDVCLTVDSSEVIQVSGGKIDGGDLSDGSVGATQLGADSVSSSELNATGVEAELEAEIDLQDLQGAVTDAQVPALEGLSIGLTDGSVLFRSTTIAQDNANFFWNDTSNILCLGCNSGEVGTKLNVVGSGTLFNFQSDNATAHAIGNLRAAGIGENEAVNLNFRAPDDGANDTVFGGLSFVVTDNTDTTEDLSLRFNIMNAGTLGTGAFSFFGEGSGIWCARNGTAGFKLCSDGDGAATFTGEGNGFDEDLTLNLDDVENEATFSSSTGVVNAKFTGMAVEVGSIAGAAPTVSGRTVYDSTANALEYGDNGTNRTVANLDEAQTFTNKDISASSNTYRAASDSATGAVELATAAETTTGTDTARAVTPDGLAGSIHGTKVASLIVIGFATTVTTGDGKFYWPLPSEFSGMDIVSVSGHVIGPSTSGAVTVDLAKCAAVATGAPCSGTVTDILSTNLTIDADEDGSETAAAAAVIDGAQDNLVTGDWVRVDVDGAGTSVEGLIVKISLRTP